MIAWIDRILLACVEWFEREGRDAWDNQDDSVW